MRNPIARREQTQPEHVDQERWFKPACDVFENEHEWLITADVPGVNPDALRLHLDGSDLTMEARRADEWFQEEFGGAGYRRAFTLPSGVAADKVSADLRQGVVTVHLPKSEAIKPRRISVTAG